MGWHQKAVIAHRREYGHSFGRYPDNEKGASLRCKTVVGASHRCGLPSALSGMRSRGDDTKGQGGEKYSTNPSSGEFFDVNIRQLIVSAADFYAYVRIAGDLVKESNEICGERAWRIRRTFSSERDKLKATRRRDCVPIYLDVLMLLNFSVDFLLLLATNRMAGYPVFWKRALLAAVVGGLYGGVCVLPGFRFFSGVLWRLLVLGFMSGIAFGFRKNSVRRGGLFFLLSMALGGIATSVNQHNLFTLFLCAGGLCVACFSVFHGRAGAQYIPVEISFRGTNLKLTALKDTGNMLTDPLTGQRIVIASSMVGCRLLGLSQEEISNPVLAVTRAPGTRLVPVQTVGDKGGMLLAKRFENVTIGSWKGSCLVAFARHDFGKGQPYNALTGGTL